MPDLRDAYLRVERANEHFEELKRVNADAVRAQGQATVIKPHGKGPIHVGETGEIAPLFEFIGGNVPIPDRCRVLVGDIVNDLRAALDYLVARLAELDSGTKQRGTQFPIEDTPQSFKRRKKEFLRGLSDAHVAAIERLQPYKGLNWTKRLRRLSNLDKHTELPIVRHTFTSDITTTPIGGADENGIQQLRVEMRLQAVLHIVLDGRWPLIETLEVIKLRVVETLDAFKPEFEG